MRIHKGSASGVIEQIVLGTICRRFRGNIKQFYNAERFNVWQAMNGGVAFDDFPTKNTDYRNRYRLYEYLIRTLELSDRPLTYLEFGVASGSSIRWWLEHSGHPDSTFRGFDVFTGLPEKWETQSKGAFSTEGKVPEVDDERCRFIAGLFQETIGDFLASTDTSVLPRPWVIHLDADLYSSTLFVLFTLHPHMLPGDMLMFDEFSSYEHEFRALEDFTAATDLKYHLFGAINNYRQIAILLD